MCRRRDACRVPSLNWVLIIGLVFCCPFQWGFLYDLGANKFEPRLELSSGPGVRGWNLISRERGCPHCSAREGGLGGAGGVPELIRRKAWLLTFPFFPVPLSPDHLLADLVITIDRSPSNLMGFCHWSGAWTFPLTAAFLLSRVRWFSSALAFRSLSTSSPGLFP